MIVHLKDIFYEEVDNNKLETELSQILDKYNINHDGYMLTNNSNYIGIEDNNGNLISLTMISKSKHIYHSIDLLNALSQFFLNYKENNKEEYFNFMKDCCYIIFNKINILLFKYDDLILEQDNDMDTVSVLFELYNIQYKITIFNGVKGNEINRLNLSMNMKNENSNEDNYFCIVKAKPIKIHNTLIIDLLYQMIIYYRYFIGYIKEYPISD